MSSGSKQEPPRASTFGAQETIDFGFKEVPKHLKQTMVGQIFSNVASSYDMMNDLMSGGLHRLWKDHLVATLHPFPGMHHLDMAGGTGDVAFRVLRALRASEVAASRLRPPQPPVAPVPDSPSSGPSSTPTAATATPAGAGSSQQVGGSPAQRVQAPPQASEPQLVGRVVVCDINPQMLEEGRHKAKATLDLAGELASGGLSFEEGNAEELRQFADESFDSYTVAFGIRNVTDRDAALREAHRVLKPGGRFLCLEFSQVSDPVLRQLYDAYSFAVIPRMGRLVAGDEASYQYLVESIRKFPDQDTWAAQIEAAGFQEVGYDSLLGGVVALHSGYKLPGLV